MKFLHDRTKTLIIFGLFLIILSVLYNLTRSDTVRYSCIGRYSSNYDGKKQVKSGAVFGIKIEKFDTLLAKGAYVNTVMMEDISDQGSALTRLYIIEEKKDNPSLMDAGVDMIAITDWKNGSQNEGDMILISHLTQTLHMVQRGKAGKWIQTFDGNCRTVNKP
jgi:hypothetical protein